MPAEVMDATALSAAIKELNESVTAGRADDVVRLMEDMRARVEPTEDLLRATKAGSILAKHSKSTDATIAAKAKTVVKAWKDVIEAQRKRKRENNDGEGEPAKKVKAEAGASPAVSTPPTPAPTSSRDVKPKIEEPSAEESKPDIKPKMGSPPSKTGLGIPPSAVASGSRSPSPSSTAAPKQETNFETIEKDRKVPRTAKSDQMSNLQADSAGDAGGSDPVRGKCVVMIYDALAGDSTASSRIIAERAVSLERAVYESFNYSTSNDYRAKLRSLFLNLKDKGNPGLRNKIVLGNLSADQVVKMSKEEMASASVKAINEKLAKDNLFKAKAVGEIQAETNAFKCSKCQQRRCSFYQMQTRSADEPMTTFVTCLNCGNKWKFC